MTVLAVTVGRRSPGELLRLATWRAVLDAASVEFDVLDLRALGSGVVKPSSLLDVARGRAVPESLVWSRSGARRALGSHPATIVVAITSRADVHELTAPHQRFILDFVDALSRSYAQRARAGALALRPAYSALRFTHARFERRTRRSEIVSVAAGRSDAEALGAEWFPLVVDVPELVRSAADEKEFDVVFFGSLSYPPNVEAVERLAEIERLGTRRWRVLIAGRRPHRRVARVAHQRGWKLYEEFTSIHELRRMASVAVSPLVSTAGIQTKVLEAAAHGLPQVVSDQALGGMADGFPAVIARTDDEFRRAVDSLLASSDERQALREAAHAHMRERYVAAAWREWARELVRP